MIEDTISLKEVLQRLFLGEEADITVVKCDITRNKGGELRTYPSANINFLAEKNDVKPSEATKFDVPTNIYSNPVYRPKPYLNLVLKNTELKKIYRVLIVKFNNQTVRI